MASANGFVANPDVGQETARDDLRLGGHAEESCNEITLSPYIVCWSVQNLSFADHRHHFIASNCLRGSYKALEAQTRPDQTLDAPVILLNDVVQELHLPEFGETPELSGTLHSLRRYRIGGILVDRDSPRIDCMCLRQGFPEEALGSSRITLTRQQKVNRLSGRIDGTVEINPLALYTNVSLIHTSGAVRRTQMRTNPLVEFGSIGLDPAEQGRVIHLHATI